MSNFWRKIMEVQIKRAVRAGNSSAVILPKAWLNKEVRIELAKKTNETILCEAMKIAAKHLDLKEVIGIYLAGSYARSEEDSESDIDILIISENTDKEMIHEGMYNILIASEKLINYKLKENLFPIGQMIKEAVPLVNSRYLKEFKVEVTENNIKWYLDTTEDKLKIVKKLVEIGRNKKIKIGNAVLYTLVLRIRTLYIIKQLIKNKEYSKKEFIATILNISKGDNAYNRYIAVKNNQKEEYDNSLKEVELLRAYLEKQLDEIRALMNKV